MTQGENPWNAAGQDPKRTHGQRMRPDWIPQQPGIIAQIAAEEAAADAAYGAGSYREWEATRKATVRRRDRHGRGPRGELMPRDVPGWRSRAQRFDDAVLDVVQILQSHLGDELNDIEFVVEDVPLPNTPGSARAIPLGRYYPPHADMPPRVQVYRRPIETRCESPAELTSLLREVIAEQLAQHMGMPPQQIDPNYGSDD